MKAGDRSILIGIGLVGLLAAFWFMALSPKRAEVKELDEQIASVRPEVEQQEQLVAAGMAAQDEFDSNYERLVVLGKAVPADDDASSLFVQISDLAAQAGIDFDAIELTAASGGEAPPAVTETTTDQASGSAAEGAPAAPTSTPVAATETAAAGLPLGATVGSAGLPTMPYKLNIAGDFFEMAKFFGELDSLVGADQTLPTVDGRLITIDGFSFAADEEKGFPELRASIAVTTYVAPEGQGLTAGATPTAPAATDSAAVPTTATTP
jgi:Tfp pilus assembly protein PilO